MKTVKKTVSTLRVVGTFLLLVSLVSSIYILASNGAAWASMRAGLQSAGVSPGIGMRLSFHSQYYRALSETVSNRADIATVRAAKAAAHFGAFASQVDTAQAELKAEQTRATLAFFENDFEYAAFCNAWEQREQNSEALEIKTVFDYLDGFSVLPGKPGKALPALKPPSSEPWFETFYTTLYEEKGEAAGTYLEFLHAVEWMVRDYTAQGNGISSATAFMEENYAWTGYQKALEAARQEERNENANGFLDDFAAFAQSVTEGETPDAQAFFDGVYQALEVRYPNEQRLDYDVFLASAAELLQSGNGFDGLYATLAADMRTRGEAGGTTAFAAFLAAYAKDIVAEADANRAIAFIGPLWRLVSAYMLVFMAGIAALALAFGVDKLMQALLMKRLEYHATPAQPDTLLEVKGLKQYFRSGEYINKAVDDVSFHVKKGEVLGLVGESGCGKTTTGRTIINLYDPIEGDVYYQGLRISSTQNGLPVLIRQLRADNESQLKAMRADLKDAVRQSRERKAELTAVFEEKRREMRRELNARITAARDKALESVVEKGKCASLYREKRLAELAAQYARDSKELTGEAAQARKRRYRLDRKLASRDGIMSRMQMIFQDPIASIDPRMTVREIIAEGLIIRGVKDKAYIDEKVYEMLELVGLVREHAERYPHEFSGGQRQRIGIARAIVLEPNLIIADEPISALDVSVQAQVINLLNELREKMGLTLIFIAHNLSVVKYFSDRIAVMYYGKIVEMTTAQELFSHPLHPYTKSLLSAIPYPDPYYEKQRKRVEYTPALAHDYAVDKPQMREIRPGHFIHCNDAEFAKYETELSA